jgi:hypothetical protein
MISTDNKPWVLNPLRPAELLRGSDTEGSNSPDEPTEADEVARLSPDETLSGRDLVVDPDAALQAFRAGGGTDEKLARWYLSGDSPVHLLRNGTQPGMLKAALKSMVPSLAKEICHEAGIAGVGAMLLAEQVVEARADEAYARMFMGIALEGTDLPQAERYEKIANRASRRMMDALDRLHRLRRPKVSVRIDKASNVNLGEQTVVNESADGAGSSIPDSRSETESPG